MRGIRLDGTRVTQEPRPGDDVVTVERRRAAHRCRCPTASRASASTPGHRPDVRPLAHARRPTWSAPARSRSTGVAAAKSDRVVPGVDARGQHSRASADPLEVRAEVVEGIRSSTTTTTSSSSTSRSGSPCTRRPGWTGPTVVGHLRGAGYRISTSGAAERQGIVQRLDVGTSGVMVIAKSRARLLACSRTPSGTATVDKTYHALVQGHPDPLRGHHRRADRPAPEVRLQVRGARGRQAQRHPLRDARGAPVRQPAGGAPRDRAHPPDPGAHGRAEAPVRRRPDLRRRPDARQRGSVWSGSGCTPSGSASSTPGRGEYVEYESSYPDDLAHALEVIRDAD